MVCAPPESRYYNTLAHDRRNKKGPPLAWTPRGDILPTAAIMFMVAVCLWFMP
jgi:hypothetical protein